jgi:hypothetical protein
MREICRGSCIFGRLSVDQRVTDEAFLQSTAVLEMMVQQVSMADPLSTPLTVHWVHTTAGGMVALQVLSNQFLLAVGAGHRAIETLSEVRLELAGQNHLTATCVWTRHSSKLTPCNVRLRGRGRGGRKIGEEREGRRERKERESESQVSKEKEKRRKRTKWEEGKKCGDTTKK